MGEMNRQLNTLRMKKIDIEDIYPQAEKDREGEKLKQLCDMHETQKNVTADGLALIERFVKPRRLVKIDARKVQAKIEQSHTKNQDQTRFLRKIERQAWKFAHTQYMNRIQQNETLMETDNKEQE